MEYCIYRNPYSALNLHVAGYFTGSLVCIVFRSYKDSVKSMESHRSSPSHSCDWTACYQGGRHNLVGNIASSLYWPILIPNYITSYLAWVLNPPPINFGIGAVDVDIDEDTDTVSGVDTNNVTTVDNANNDTATDNNAADNNAADNNAADNNAAAEVIYFDELDKLTEPAYKKVKRPHRPCDDLT